MYAEMSEENEEIKKALAELEGAIEEEEYREIIFIFINKNIF